MAEKPTPIGGSPDQQGRELERQLLAGEISYSQLNAGQRYAYGGVRQQNITGVYGARAPASAPGIYTPGIPYSPDARKKLEAEFADKLNKGSGFKMPSWMKPVEQVASGLYWVYSKFISQPVSFASIYGRQINNLVYGEDSNFDIQDAWEAARYTSPGQAIYMSSMSNAQLRANGIEPTNLASTRTEVDKYFSKGPQKWISGVADLTVSWYADPFYLALKGVGATRKGAYVKPTKDIDFNKFGDSKTLDAISKNVRIASEGATADQATARLMRDVPLFARSRTNGTGQVMAEMAVRTGGDKSKLAMLIQFAAGDPKMLKSLERNDMLLASSMQSVTRRVSDLGIEKAALVTRGDQPAELAAVNARLEGLAHETAVIMDQYADNMKMRSIFATQDKLYTRNNLGPLAQKARMAMKERPVSPRYTEPGPPNAMTGHFAQASMRAWERGGDLIYNGTIYPMIKLYRGFQDVRPSHYLKIDDAESYRHVDAMLQEVKYITPEVRNDMVGKYMKASVKDRPIILQNIESGVVREMAKRADITEDTAMRLYKDFFARRGALSSGNLYTTARRADGSEINLIGVGSGGSRDIVAPLLKTQLADNWVMMDFNRMQKIMDRSGKAIERLLKENPGEDLLSMIAQKRVHMTENTREISEALNSLWKFTQLARPGYMPRAIGDELLGQVAALGPLMMMSRVAEGSKNVGMKLMDRTFQGGWMNSIRQGDALTVGMLDGTILEMSTTITKNENRLRIMNDRLGRAKTASKRKAIRRDYDNLTHENKNLLTELEEIRLNRAEINNRLATSGEKNIDINGRAFEGATAGTSGAMYKSMLSASTTINNLMGRSSSNMLLRSRSIGWAPVMASMDEAGHTSAWLRALTHQIRNDELAMLRVDGADVAKMESWLKSPAGVAYRREHPRATQLPEEFAADVAAHVDRYLPEEMLGRDEVINLLKSEKLTGKELKDSMKLEMRPDVHSEQLAFALGNKNMAAGRLAESIDGTMAFFYKWMNEMPSQHLSRNPLFAQLYRSHLKDTVKNWDLRGGSKHLSPSEYEALEGAARKLALRDTKGLVFNMDYEARVAYALRFMAPFFGAQLEAWTRWSRIVADKPQIIARAAQAYQAPSRAGMTTTYNGDHIDGYGYATNSETGERYKVDKSDTFINIPIPQEMTGELSRAMGVNVTDLQIPLNSLNLVLQNEPAFSPGFGPMVQIPVNEFITGGKLGPMEYEGQYQYGDLVQELGILPFGPTAESSTMLAPTWVQRFMKADDESSREYISNFTLVMNMEMWQYENGGRETKPTAKEIRDKARKFTFFTALSSYVAPFKTDYKNPLQFYMDAYKKVQQTGVEDPQKAFLDKYGESMWMFTTALTKSNSGMPSTTASIKIQKTYQSLIDELDDPSLARLIEGGMAGDEFSKTAYVYQLTNEIQTGSGVMGREKLAPKEAMDRAEADRGWYLFNKAMTGLQAKLYERGLTSFDDDAASDLRAMRKGYVDNLTKPEFNGKANKFYNEAWSKQYLTVDPLRMERKIADMRKIVSDPGLQELSNVGTRTDIGTLAMYIRQRDIATKALSIRNKAGGSDDITAQANDDIRRTFAGYTDMLIESDTRFGELHNRYLHSDMGYNLELRGTS